jgi:hypothetical protein
VVCFGAALRFEIYFTVATLRQPTNHPVLIGDCATISTTSIQTGNRVAATV